MKRAVIYARLSKEREASVSIEAQIEHCTARALQLGATVVRVFQDEGISGREARNRTAFQHAKAFCEAANVEYFITWSTSRFARNMMELFISEAELRGVGTTLECLNADINDETDSGLVNKAINGLMDELYSRQVARDTLRSQKKSAADGFFTGGRYPFGYRTVKVGARSRMEICPVDGPIAARVFELAGEGLGAQAIALRMNEEQLLRAGAPWTKNTVNYTLRSETYTGVRTFNKTHRRTRKVKPREEWIQVESHPALVDRETFERIQAMMTARAPAYEHGGTPRSTFLFTGLATCGICSGRLQICTGKGRGGTLYSYYGCVAHRHGSPRCALRQVRADLFDEWLLGEILARVITPGVMVEAMQDLLVAGAQWVRDRETRRAQIVAGMREQEARRDKLFELLERDGRDTPDLAAVAQRLRERTAELEQLQRDLITLEATPAPRSIERVDPAVAVEVMREVIAAADTKKKRAFLGAFLEKILLGPTTVTIDYRPEALLSTSMGAGVRSECRWLPVASSLRTKSILVDRPCFRRAACVSRRSA
jgi:site-specific DNA recombinase